MSEAMTIPPLGEAPAKRTPTVYFIDDSATMREVIKIAFRRENIHVITCADAASALAQFEQTRPDVVITDVIMPDQDGYSVCSQIKQHPEFSEVPVVLMSGVVNKSVADKAVSVQADELIRKPFQPQELIGRVKSLLQPKSAVSTAARQARTSASEENSLSSLFTPPTAQPGAPLPAAYEPRAAESAWPRALAEAFSPRPTAPAAPTTPAQPGALATQRAAGPTAHDLQKLRAEILRLELLIKKLQTELQIEREYNQTLELHIKTLRESE